LCCNTGWLKTTEEFILEEKYTIALIVLATSFFGARLMMREPKNEDRIEVGFFGVLIVGIGVASYVYVTNPSGHWGWWYIAVGIVGLIAGNASLGLLTESLTKAKKPVQKTVGQWDLPTVDDDNHLGI
jgi:hypothetical protein